MAFCRIINRWRCKRRGGFDLKAKKHIRISQCMIVKNEEKNIERALSWGKDMMWEQIVVDTGSTDRTAELAREMGAKVFSLEWPEDFAAAKNYAIDQAKGEWIAFLDADEYMMPDDATKLRQILEQMPEEQYDGISTGWQQLNDERNIFASATQVRFFRNLSDIRYRRKIHEQLVSLSGRKLHILDAVREFSIFHTGYQSETSQKKRGRNKKLILEELKKCPNDYEMMGYMGDECLGETDMDQAEEWYRRSVEQMPADLKEYDQRSAVTFTKLLMLLADKKDAVWEKLEEIYIQAVHAFPSEADFDYIAGRFFAAHEQPGKAVGYLELALEKLNTYGCTNKALFLAGNLEDAYAVLARCCYESGEVEKCVSYAVSYLKYDRYQMQLLHWLFKALFQDNGAVQDKEKEETVMEFLSRLYDVSALKDRLFLIKTAQKAGCKGFADYASDCFFTLEEQKMLDLQ